ncbi:MAG: tryptophan synthase subunit alpha [Bacteroidales bacterium]|nr:tryptophan synthase subunit alpha [Bacteroidales bacterium]
MQNRINQLFQKKTAEILSIYFTAGFPALEDTLPVLRELQAQGVDMVEIGIPFSDPMADGPVIQASGNAALHNGMTLHKLFDQLSDMRSDIHIPVILMGYLNVVMQFGLESFCQACKKAGVDGVILPDLPMSDYLSEYKPMMDKYGLAMVLLITPETSEERIRNIDENTSSFIYMVSSASTTGAQKSFDEGKQAYFRKINSMGLKNPRLIGFGISNKATLDAAFENASGAIIGSRFMECLGKEKTIAGAVNILLEGLKAPMS